MRRPIVHRQIIKLSSWMGDPAPWGGVRVLLVVPTDAGSDSPVAPKRPDRGPILAVGSRSAAHVLILHLRARAGSSAVLRPHRPMHPTGVASDSVSLENIFFLGVPIAVWTVHYRLYAGKRRRRGHFVSETNPESSAFSKRKS